MSEWYCFKCKEKMEEKEVTLVYLEIEGKTEGLVCPKCGAKYITEDIAVEQVAKGEKMIEEK
jgi:YgiT-type zinc finger domain-containing protein